MANKKGGTTDLVKMLAMLAERLTPIQYQKVREVCFALLNGVNYGYDTLGPQFLQDSADIFQVHNTQSSESWRVSSYRRKTKLRKRKNYKGPVPKALKNKKYDTHNVINLQEYLK